MENKNKLKWKIICYDEEGEDYELRYMLADTQEKIQKGVAEGNFEGDLDPVDFIIPF